MKKETSDLFRKLGITVDLTQPMKKMSVSQRQMCEIAKAISYHSKVIVLDEPTSSLTAPEVEKLFKMMRQLKAQGIALIYISHKMDEIFEICDEISVLRDGSLVMTKPSKETDMNELIAAENKATAYALTKAGRQNYTITLPEVNEFTLGQLMYLFELQTAYAGALFHIDTFNQPGVEAGKQATYALLGKKGFEAKREELDNAPKAEDKYIV